MGEDKQERVPNALTREIDDPGKGHLDAYLQPFKGPAITYERLAGEIVRAPGLAGDADPEADKVIGRTSEPAVQAAYEQIQMKRKQLMTGTDGYFSRVGRWLREGF